MTQATKTQKTVQVLTTYTFKHICRVCFVVLSSNGVDHYHTCFDNGKASCNCPAGQKGRICYHVTQLRPRYNSTVAARKEFHKQQETPAATTEHRVSRVHGVAGACWYPEYCKNGEWFRYPLEGTTHAVSFFDEAPARAWLADRLAAIAEQAAEAKLAAFKAGPDYDTLGATKTTAAQREAKQRTAQETNDSNLRAFYNGL